MTELPQEMLLALRSGDHRMRLNTLHELAKAPRAAALSEVEALVADADPEVSYMARRALEALRTAAGQPERPSPQIEARLAQLDSNSAGERLEAIGWLKSQSTVAPVMEAMRCQLPLEEDEGVRAALLVALGEAQAPALIDDVKPYLGSSDRRVRLAALRALAKLDRSEAETAASSLSRDEAAAVRVFAVEVLSPGAPADAVRILWEMAREPDVEFRQAACELLGRAEFELSSRHHLLLHLACDEAPQIRRRALTLLGESSPAPEDLAPLLERHWQPDERRLVELLARRIGLTGGVRGHEDALTAPGPASSSAAAGAASERPAATPLVGAVSEASAVSRPAWALAANSGPPLQATPVVGAVAGYGAGAAPSAQTPREVKVEPPQCAYARTLEELLREACSRGASDIHIGVGRPPQYRILGRMEITSHPVVKPETARWLAYQLLDEGQRLVFEDKLDVDTAHELPGGSRFRVNVFYDVQGVGLVLRVVPSKLCTLEELGVPAAARRFLEESRGLVLITGPTGSGKSTTLAAMVAYLNAARTGHIITIEDPVEFRHQPMGCRVTQREVGTSARSFAGALRAALREDPDVIMVGEMRDRETIELALTAAETGHLVLSTLHTQSAAKTIDRIISVFPAAQQDQVRTVLAETLVGIVCQALLPRRTGEGRIAAYEVLCRVPAVSNLIRENKVFQIGNVMMSHRGQGMKLLDEELARLVKSGAVRAEDALPLAVDRAALEAKLG